MTKYTGNSFLSLAVVTGLIGAFALTLYAFNNPKNLLTSQAKRGTTVTGSGAPSGPHYNLNIIGVPKNKIADMTGNQGHRIFVPLKGSCKIDLGPGDFQVLDANCTKGNASFQLPNPDPDNDGETIYSVWARALGKPGGQSTTTTCATDPLTGDEWCSVYSMVAVRQKGKNSLAM
jgi:hypothetical protein